MNQEKKKYGLKRSAPRVEIDYEKELNPQQLSAVLAPDGPALVIAGAGSGKTRIVTYRVAHLLQRGVRPEEILLLTFTKKAAEEMLRRVGDLVSADLSGLWGGTFHHIGNRVLRRHAELLGYRNNYTILDREDSRVLIEAAARETGSDPRDKHFPKGRVLLEIVGYGRNTGIDVSEAVEVKAPHFSGIADRIERAAQRYSRRKRELNYLDFDDLLLLLEELLSRHPEVSELYRRRFKHILVDEYQDTNIVQARIVELFGGGHRNIMVVGDDSQSIYSFRGALFRNIREFPRQYPGCRVFTVETNYRSTPEILSFANRVIERVEDSYSKTLRPVKKPGALPALVRTGNVYEQADFVAQRISELIDEGVNPSEIAVLYRAHYHSMEVQMELARREIPFTVRSGIRFFEQAHIKDVISYLKVIDNPRDEIAWKRIIVRLPRVGPRTAEKIWAVLRDLPDPLAGLDSPPVSAPVPSRAREAWSGFCRTIRRMSKLVPRRPADLIGVVLESDYDDYLQSEFANYERRLDDLLQLARYAARYEDLEQYLDELAMIGGLVAEDIEPGERREMVVLSTVHQAKGLEWDAVFMIWLAEGKFPAAASYGDDAALEEERRLFYVAATRCRSELYLLYPFLLRQRSGEESLQNPSRFLSELPPSSYEEWEIYDI
ncbi:MAG: ATP-dependent helicase [Candidatus Erginobacter occultus]|nr:ATP-dependent helicase [Candidatus Erginobacter occultus]